MIDTDFFTLFGLERAFKQDPIKIKACYLKLMQQAHPDKHASSGDIEVKIALDYSAWINKAYKTLMTPLKRALYLLKLEGIDVGSQQMPFPVDFLMEQMALREELAQIKTSTLSAAVKLDEIQKQAASASIDLENEFDQCLRQRPPDFVKATLCVQKLQFYASLMEEIHQQQIMVT